MIRIESGLRVLFHRGDGTIQADTVRDVIWQETLSEQGIAVILKEHSWCWAHDIVEPLTPPVESCEAGTCRHQQCARERVARRRAEARRVSLEEKVLDEYYSIRTDP